MIRLRPTSLNRTTWNIVANLLGQGSTGLMGFICYPLYARFLGPGPFGLVGFYLVVQGLLLPLDLGLSTTLNRELARLSVQKEQSQAMRDLVRTLEILYWGIGLILGLVVFLLAGWIAEDWFRANSVDLETRSQAVQYMALVLVVQWPVQLYTAAILGLQRQVSLNAIYLGIGVLRYGGSVAILAGGWPTVAAYFSWQFAICLLHTLILAGFLWWILPPGPQPARFQHHRLGNVWRFAAGLSALSIAWLFYMQLDKVLLSNGRFLTLEEFSYYILAALLASGLASFSEPIYAALFPRFSQLAVLVERQEMKTLYHGGCQLLAALVLSVTVVLAWFAPEILFLWTRDVDWTDHTAGILRVLVVAMALAMLNRLPLGLQLAHGWTRLGFFLNVAAFLVLAPLFMIVAPRWGGVGTALVLVVVNGAYTVINLQVMHRYLLPGEQARWYAEDVGWPLVGAVAAGGLARWLFPESLPPLEIFFSLAGVTIFVLGTALLAGSRTRRWLREGWSLLAS
jgi:O-antigen/teichoic acid export membrane protein